VVDDNEVANDFEGSFINNAVSPYLTLLQIRNDNDAIQSAGGNGPLLKYRVVRYDPADPPPDSTADTDPKMEVIFDPDEPVSLSTTGFLPAAMISQFDEPGLGTWKYEIQVKWEKFIYDIGTVTITNSGQWGGTPPPPGYTFGIQGNGTLWRSFVDQSTLYRTNRQVDGSQLTIGVINQLPHEIRVGSPLGAWTGPIAIIDQTTAVSVGALANGATQPYEIRDNSQAPHVEATYALTNSFVVKK
jgi:hypothetical protein